MPRCRSQRPENHAHLDPLGVLHTATAPRDMPSFDTRSDMTYSPAPTNSNLAFGELEIPRSWSILRLGVLHDSVFFTPQQLIGACPLLIQDRKYPHSPAPTNSNLASRESGTPPSLELTSTRCSSLFKASPLILKHQPPPSHISNDRAPSWKPQPPSPPQIKTLIARKLKKKTCSKTALCHNDIAPRIDTKLSLS